MAIDIKINKDQTVEGQAPDIGQEREAGKPSIQKQAVNSALINAGKQIITQGVTQYGNLTGDYATVNNINAVLSIASDISIAATGPVGVVAVLSKKIINIGNSVVNQITAIRNIELQRQRSGFISTQGSRYK